MADQEVLNELKKIKEIADETLKTLVALKMGVIGFDKIDRDLKEIKNKLK